MSIVLVSVALEWFPRTWQMVKTDLLFKETPNDFVISQTNFWTLVRLMSVWFKEFYLLQTPAIPRGKLMAMSDEICPTVMKWIVTFGNALTPPLGPWDSQSMALHTVDADLHLILGFWTKKITRSPGEFLERKENRSDNLACLQQELVTLPNRFLPCGQFLHML